MSERRVFISYSHADQDWARQFAESLRSLGVNVWFDQWSILAGDPLAEVLERGLRQSDVLVLLIGSESAKQPYVFFELGAAIGMGKRVVPIVPQDVDPAQLPPPVRFRKYLVKRSPQETAEELAAELNRLPPVEAREPVPDPRTLTPDP